MNELRVQAEGSRCSRNRVGLVQRMSWKTSQWQENVCQIGCFWLQVAEDLTQWEPQSCLCQHVRRCPVWGWLWGGTRKLGKEQQYWFWQTFFSWRVLSGLLLPLASLQDGCPGFWHLQGGEGQASSCRSVFWGLVFKTKRTFSTSFRQTSHWSLWPK